MTQPELEKVLRDTFREHEAAVDGLSDGLLPVARARWRQRVRAGAIALGLVAMGIVGATVVSVLDHSGPGPLDGPSPVGPGAVPVPGGGWMMVSSLGLEIEIPRLWEINDYGCHMTDRPSVVRGRGAEEGCFTPEPPAKRVAIIGATPDRTYAGLTYRDVTVDREAATLLEGRLPDGRYAAQLAIPRRGVFLDIRTSDQGELTRILASARLVEVDHLGCPTNRPEVNPPPTPVADFAPYDAQSVRVCYYGAGGDFRLQASAELNDEAQLIAAVNAAPPGRNPDPPQLACHNVYPVVPDVVLQFVRARGVEVFRVWVTFSPCTGRGLDNGVRRAQINPAMIALIMNPLHTGYAFNSGLGPSVK